MAVEATPRLDISDNPWRQGGLRRSARPLQRDGSGTNQSESGAKGERLTHGVGWLSLGLGVAQLIAPDDVAGLLGLRNDRDHRSLLRTEGVREIASGLGFLTGTGHSNLHWSRAAGDAMSLVLLATATKDRPARRNRAAIAAAAIVGATIADWLSSRARSRRHRRLATSAERGEQSAEHGVFSGLHTKKAITIRRSPEEVYRFWHDFENLPRFMRHLESVQVKGARRSHWKARGPAGSSVEWEAEIVDDQVNERIAWQSLPGSDLDHAGSVRFVQASAGRGTEVLVELTYRPPGGLLGKAFAKLFGEAPDQQLADDLRILKQVLELGEVVRSDASVHHGPHPARPSATPAPPSETATRAI